MVPKLIPLFFSEAYISEVKIPYNLHSHSITSSQNRHKNIKFNFNAAGDGDGSLKELIPLFTSEGWSAQSESINF